MDFDQAIKELAYFRNEVATSTKIMNDILEKAKADPLYQFAQAKRISDQGFADRFEIEIRAAAVAQFREDQNKHPYPAVGIRENTLVLYDKDVAISWCMEHMPGALTLDRARFEKHAKATADTLPLKFVNIIKEPSATIAEDLSQYLITDTVASLPADGDTPVSRE